MKQLLGFANANHTEFFYSYILYVYITIDLDYRSGLTVLRVLKYKLVYLRQHGDTVYSSLDSSSAFQKHLQTTVCMENGLKYRNTFAFHDPFHSVMLSE